MAFDKHSPVIFTVGTAGLATPQTHLKFRVTQQGSFMGSGEIYADIGQAIANVTDQFVLMHGDHINSMSFSPDGKEIKHGR